MKESSQTPDYGEPWEMTPDERLISANGEEVKRDGFVMHRAINCVNACQGLADPAAEIAAMREAIKEAREVLLNLEHEGNEKGTSCPTCGSHCSQPHKADCAMASALTKLQPFIQ
jgi:hypothetical protein